MLQSCIANVPHLLCRNVMTMCFSKTTKKKYSRDCSQVTRAVEKICSPLLPELENKPLLTIIINTNHLKERF